MDSPRRPRLVPGNGRSVRPAPWETAEARLCARQMLATLPDPEQRRRVVEGILKTRRLLRRAMTHAALVSCLLGLPAWSAAGTGTAPEARPNAVRTNDGRAAAFAPFCRAGLAGSAGGCARQRSAPVGEDFADFWEAVQRENRLRRVARLVPQPNEPIADPQAVLASVRAYCHEWRIPQEQVARAIGVEPFLVAALFEELERVPEQARGKLLRELNAWVEADFRERLTARPANFVATAAARLILATAQTVKATGTVGLVTGPAGMGKSLTLQVVAAELPGAMLVRVDCDARGWRGLLRKIAIASQLSPGQGGLSLAAVIHRLSGTGRLLVLDEAHQLFDASLELVRSLHDEAGLPVLLVGTVAIERRLRDDADPLFGQFSSRIALRCDLVRQLLKPGGDGRRLEWISAAELRAIFERERVKLHADATQLLLKVANFEVGHLRRVKNILALAERLAVARQGVVTIEADHVLRAIRLVTGLAVGEIAPPPPEVRPVVKVGT